MKTVFNFFFFLFVCSVFVVGQGKYIIVGGDPQDIKRNVHQDEMLIKYLKDVYIQTHSGSGKITSGWLRAGEPLIVKKADFHAGEISDFTILQCGNETNTYSRSGVSSPVFLDMNSVEVIWNNEPQIVEREKKVYVPLSATEYNPSPNYYPPYPQKQSQPSVEKGNDNTVWYILGGIAVAALVYAVIENNNRGGVTINNYGTGTGGGSTGGGPVNPPNGPASPPNGRAATIPRGIVIGTSFGF